jgi:hypothetical protein
MYTYIYIERAPPLDVKKTNHCEYATTVVVSNPMIALLK